MKKVKYTAQSNTLNNNDVYEVVKYNAATNSYKIRNDDGRLVWYSQNSFIEVKDRVLSAKQNNSLPTDLINKIERELKETEERMVNLRQELENAKNPPTKNIFERATRAHGGSWSDDAENVLDDFADALCHVNELDFSAGLALGIANYGDGIILDRDYDWKIVEREGTQILQILDR